jgi:hypothetical protein
LLSPIRIRHVAIPASQSTGLSRARESFSPGVLVHRPLAWGSKTDECQAKKA